MKPVVSIGTQSFVQVALESFSSFDAGYKPWKETAPERFYQGFAFEGKKVLIG